MIENKSSNFAYSVLDSQDLAEKFIQQIENGKNQFKDIIPQDKPEFSNKLREIIHQVSQISVGKTLLQQILEEGKSFVIVEGKSDLEGGNWFISNPICMSLNFDHEYYYISRNEKGENEIVKGPDIMLFIHEAVHLKHCIQDSEAMKARSNTPSALKKMDETEEELTINGSIVGTNEVDCCSENAALQELKLPLRINHRGAVQDSLSNCLMESIEHKAMPNIRKILSTPEGQKAANEESDKLLSYCIKKIVNKKHLSSKHEYYTMANILIANGCKSNVALKSLLGGLRSETASEKEDLELVHLLIGEKCESSEVLLDFFESIKKIDNPLERSEYLQLCQKLITSGCASNSALEMASRQVSNEKDATRKNEWLCITEQLLQKGYKWDNLDIFVNFISHVGHVGILNHCWEIMRPVIIDQLEIEASERKEDLFKNIKLLVKAGCTSTSLDFFHTLLLNDQAFIRKKTAEFKNEIPFILELISEDFKTHEKLLCEYLTGTSSLTKFMKLDALVKASVYIAICGKGTAKMLLEADGIGMPQLEKMRDFCEGIIREERRIQEKKNEKLGVLSSASAFLINHMMKQIVSSLH